MRNLCKGLRERMRMDGLIIQKSRASRLNSLSTICAIGTGTMKHPSRCRAAVALLVALHALWSVELIGQSQQLPSAEPTLTMTDSPSPGFQQCPHACHPQPV